MCSIPIELCNCFCEFYWVGCVYIIRPEFQTSKVSMEIDLSDSLIRSQFHWFELQSVVGIQLCRSKKMALGARIHELKKENKTLNQETERAKCVNSQQIRSCVGRGECHDNKRY